MQLGPNRLDRGQLRVGVPFLGDELAAHLGGRQAGVQAGTAEGGVGLALPIDERRDVGQQLGRCAALRLRPRRAKASTMATPRANARAPLRIVSRSQPNSRAARRCPPAPHSRTVRAMKMRRALPFSAWAVSMNSALPESVSSIHPPTIASLLPARE